MAHSFLRFVGELGERRCVGKLKIEIESKSKVKVCFLLSRLTKTVISNRCELLLKYYYAVLNRCINQSISFPLHIHQAKYAVRQTFPYFIPIARNRILIRRYYRVTLDLVIVEPSLAGNNQQRPFKVILR